MDFKPGGTIDVDKVLLSGGDMYETASSVSEVPEKAVSEISEIASVDACDLLEGGVHPNFLQGDPAWCYCESVDGCDTVSGVDVPADVPAGVDLAPDEWLVGEERYEEDHGLKSDSDEPYVKRAKVVVKSPRFKVVDGARVEVEGGDKVPDDMRMLKQDKVVKLNVCWQVAIASLGGSKHEFKNAAAVEKLRGAFENSPYVYQAVLRAVSGKRKVMEPLHEFCKGGGYDGIWGNLSSKIKKEGSLHGLRVDTHGSKVFFYLEE